MGHEQLMSDLTQEQFIEAIADRVVARLTPLLNGKAAPAASTFATTITHDARTNDWYVGAVRMGNGPLEAGFYAAATNITPARGTEPTTFVDPLDGKTYPLPDRLKGIAAPFGYYWKPGPRAAGAYDGMAPKSNESDIGL